MPLEACMLDPDDVRKYLAHEARGDGPRYDEEAHRVHTALRIFAGELFLCKTGCGQYTTRRASKSGKRCAWCAEYDVPLKP